MSTKTALVALPSGALPEVRSHGDPAPPGENEAGQLPALAFQPLYARHVHFVWRSLRLLGVAPESLEDAAQDTFAVVARQLASFEGRSSLSTWIFGITQRVAANHRRAHQRKLARLEPLTGNVACTAPTPQAAAEATEAAEAVERFSERLNTERRRLFILAILEGIPAQEIAAAEGVPLNTLYSRIRSLRQELRKFLQLREEDAGRDNPTRRAQRRHSEEPRARHDRAGVGRP